MKQIGVQEGTDHLCFAPAEMWTQVTEFYRKPGLAAKHLFAFIDPIQKVFENEANPQAIIFAHRIGRGDS